MIEQNFRIKNTKQLTFMLNIWKWMLAPRMLRDNDMIGNYQLEYKLTKRFKVKHNYQQIL